MFYVQIVCISTVSIIMSPRWIAAIILVFALFAISRYARDYWNEFTQKCFFTYIVKKGSYFVKMEGESLFITSSNTFIWNRYIFLFLFIASCNHRDSFYIIDGLDCILP